MDEFNKSEFKQKLNDFMTRIEHEHDMNHDMIGHDVCHEVINPIICHESCHESKPLKKDEWFYLVNTLESWRVYNPRSVVKKNPILAWQIMNLCKDKRVRVKGAYFTTCFRRELAKLA